MDALLSFIMNPFVIILIAVGVFTGRVFYLAKRLKAASKDVTFADLRALEEAKKALDAHKQSLDMAKRTLSGNIGASRDTLRHYKRPYTNSVEGRRREIETSMKELDKFDEPLTRARAEQKEALHKGIRDAKKLYKGALPHKTHRAPKDI